MYQGLYGLFPFTVTDLEVCTFRDLKVTKEQAYAIHNVVDGKPRVQHTGLNLMPVTLTVLVAPMTAVSTAGLRLRLLETMTRTGTELPLVIGLKYYGLFVLQSYEVTHKQIHYGTTLFAEVQLSLLEYN